VKSIAGNFCSSQRARDALGIIMKRKMRSFYVQSGKISLRHSSNDEIEFSDEIILSKGDKFHVYRNQRHQMLALEDTELFEFSTEHFDEDSHRVIPGD
jgi:quercetin dioxygenase-like cupin family protein